MPDPYDRLGAGDEQTMLAAFGIYAALFGVLLVVAAISFLLTAVPLAALFSKAGVERWKAWVPIYNTYVWLQLGGQSGHWLWLSFIPYGSIVTSIFLYIGMFRTGKAFGKEGGFLVLGIFLPWIWLFILGFGRDLYRPELIAAAGLRTPLIGHGAATPTATSAATSAATPAVTPAAASAALRQASVATSSETAGSATTTGSTTD